MTHDKTPGIMKVLIMMNHNLSKLYHQKNKGDPNYIVCDLYDQLEVDKDGYEF